MHPYSAVQEVKLLQSTAKLLAAEYEIKRSQVRVNHKLASV